MGRVHIRLYCVMTIVLLLIGVTPVLSLPDPPTNWTSSEPWYLGYSPELPATSPLIWEFEEVVANSSTPYLEEQTMGWVNESDRISISIVDGIEEFNVINNQDVSTAEKMQYFDVQINGRQVNTSWNFNIYVKHDPEAISNTEIMRSSSSGPSINLVVPVREIYMNMSESNFFVNHKYVQPPGRSINATYSDNIYCISNNFSSASETREMTECININLGLVTFKSYTRIDEEGTLSLQYRLLTEDLPIDPNLQMREVPLEGQDFLNIPDFFFPLVGVLLLSSLSYILYRKYQRPPSSGSDLYPKNDV